MSGSDSPSCAYAGIESDWPRPAILGIAVERSLEHAAARHRSSHKDYTHGCIETCDELKDELLRYRRSADMIRVLVNDDGVTSTGRAK